VLEAYAEHLDDESYAHPTEYLELTTLKQAMKWMIDEGHQPEASRFRLPLRKPTGTDTFCWKPEEAGAIIAHCRANPDLQWLGDVFTAPIATGMRMSELAGLRWSDVDGETNTIRLTDETASRRTDGRRVRQSRSRRDGAVPIDDDLERVLAATSSAADGLVFHGPRGGIINPDTVRTFLVRDVLTPLAEKFPTPAGEVGFKKGRLHSCRHYFASRCAADGYAEQVVMT